jgi:hypothetical protein
MSLNNLNIGLGDLEVYVFVELNVADHSEIIRIRLACPDTICSRLGAARAGECIGGKYVDINQANKKQ